MKKYFILNVDSDPKKRDMGPSIFYDPGADLKIISKDPNNPDPKEGYEGLMTKKIQSAIKNGHIREITAKTKSTKGTAPAAAPDAPTDLEAMNDEQLLAYYREGWDVKKKDEEAFLKMSTEEKRTFLAED
jgi:hypothetical protein